MNFQAGFRKGRGTKDQIANICWVIKKAREYQKKKILRRGGKNTQKNYTKKILMTWIKMRMWTLRESDFLEYEASL